VASLLLAACGTGSGASDAGQVVVIVDEPDAQGSDASSSTGPRECAPLPGGGAWSAGTAAFEDATARAGFDAAGAVAVRISAADIDGDGYTDLALRRVSSTGDDLGEDGRRSTWLMRNTGGGAFEDVTLTSGFITRRDGDATRGRPTEVVVFGDVDNDGDLDAYSGLSNPQGTLTEGAEVLLNDGQGNFTLAPPTPALQLAGQASVRGGASFTDYDRDGVLDLFVTHGGTEQDRLYKGAGDGTFTEVTAAVGLETVGWFNLADINAARAHTNSWGAAACDLNGDGAPELLSSSYGRAPNHLWQSVTRGAARYTNRSVASGYAFDERADWSDNESARCHCQLNPGDPGCDGVPAPRLIRCQQQSDAFRWNHANDREAFRLGGNSGTTVCGDVDADGDLDLLTTEIVHWDVGLSSDPSELLLNDGGADVTFTRPGRAALGLGRARSGQTWDDGDITGALFDFDNDGRLDVLINSTDYPGTRALLFHQQEDGTFRGVPITDGIDHTSAHGVAVADFDRDGDLDLVIGHSRGRCSSGDHCYPDAHARYFENVVGSRNRWLQLELVGGDGSNRAAIGAQATVAWGERRQLAEVGGGHGHYGVQHGTALHFGLGEACEVEVTVRWPDASNTTETFTLGANARYRITQGGQPEVVAP
jgi:hypothetical protein